MRRNDVIRMSIAFMVLVVLHYTARPALEWRVSIDFLLIAVMLVSMKLRPGLAAVVGFAVGLLADVQSPATLGTSALGLAAIGYAVSQLQSSFFSDKSSLNIFLIFIGKWVYDLAFILIQREMSAGEMLLQLAVWSPIAAALTAIAGALTLTFLRPLIRESRA